MAHQSITNGKAYKTHPFSYFDGTKSLVRNYIECSFLVAVLFDTIPQPQSLLSKPLVAKFVPDLRATLVRYA